MQKGQGEQHSLIYINFPTVNTVKLFLDFLKGLFRDFKGTMFLIFSPFPKFKLGSVFSKFLLNMSPFFWQPRRLTVLVMASHMSSLQEIFYVCHSEMGSIYCFKIYPLQHRVEFSLGVPEDQIMEALFMHFFQAFLNSYKYIFSISLLYMYYIVLYNNLYVLFLDSLNCMVKSNL